MGRAVFPDIGGGSFTPTDLGQGAETTAALLHSQAGSSGFDFVLVSFTPGPHRAANVASFLPSMTRFCLSAHQTATCAVTDQRPNGVTNYAGIDATPAVLAALLAVIGVTVLGQFIVVSGRRRRRDFHSGRRSAVSPIPSRVGPVHPVRREAGLTPWAVSEGLCARLAPGG